MALTYFILFLVSLFVGSFVCVGIWIASDGVTEEMVDGSEKDTDKMVLYWLYKLIANPRKKHFEYDKYHLVQLLVQLKKEDSVFNDCIVDGNSVLVFPNDKDVRSVYTCIKKADYLKGIDIKLDLQRNGIVFSKYVWEVNFFSKPIIACIKCFPSFWGSITYWTIVYLSSKIGFLTEINYNVLVPIWLFTVVCMPPLNIILEKLTRNEH